MANDPLLSQAEIDELLRSLQGGPREETPAQNLGTRAAVVQERPVAALDLPPSLALLRNVPIECSVELGETWIHLGELLQIGRSTLLVFQGQVDAPVLLRVNGVPFARCVVVESQGRYAVRLTEMLAGEGAL